MSSWVGMDDSRCNSSLFHIICFQLTFKSISINLFLNYSNISTTSFFNVWWSLLIVKSKHWNHQQNLISCHWSHILWIHKMNLMVVYEYLIWDLLLNHWSRVNSIIKLHQAFKLNYLWFPHGKSFQNLKSPLNSTTIN